MNSAENITFSLEDIPDLVSINLPFFASSVDKAIDMLGGEAVVRKAILNKSTFIQAKLPTANVLKPSMIGHRENHCDVVLKLRRRRSAQADEPFSVEVVGKTVSVYSFEQPCDIQVILRWYNLHRS